MINLILIGCASLPALGHPVRRELVDVLKKKAAWQVHDIDTNPFASFEHDRLRKMLSTSPVSMDAETQPPALTKNHELPLNFDPRNGTQFPGKCIHPIRDQQQCGSCWAFGSTESLSDRFCIAGKDVVLAPQDPVACDSGNNGCDGGYLEEVWEYLTTTGVVSEACWPYISGNGVVGKCRKSCVDANQAWTKYRCLPGSIVHPKNTADIQFELHTHGPLEGAFTVYEDFFNYKSGVYYHIAGASEGGHAIKVIGWGHDEPTGDDYWICANSWGSGWGENGFFRIRMGDSGINEMMFGCLPDVDSSYEELEMLAVQ